MKHIITDHYTIDDFGTILMIDLPDGSIKMYTFNNAHKIIDKRVA